MLTIANLVELGKDVERRIPRVRYRPAVGEGEWSELWDDCQAFLENARRELLKQSDRLLDGHSSDCSLAEFSELRRLVARIEQKARLSGLL